MVVGVHAVRLQRFNRFNGFAAFGAHASSASVFRSEEEVVWLGARGRRVRAAHGHLREVDESRGAGTCDVSLRWVTNVPVAIAAETSSTAPWSDFGAVCCRYLLVLPALTALGVSRSAGTSCSGAPGLLFWESHLLRVR